MPDIKIYTPFAGTNWGQTNYCYVKEKDGKTAKPHAVTKYSLPFDIGRSDATPAVQFTASATCKSIRISHFEGVCRSRKSPWTGGVIVEVFSELDAKSLRGILLYGHVKDRTAEGIYNKNDISLGSLISSNDASGCYQGIHVHMEANNSFSRTVFSCGGAITKGATIYSCSWK